MHISIPTSEEVSDDHVEGKPPVRYVLYNIHINGTYHCSARYSVLRDLHERLKKKYGAGCLEQFPGKQLFYLTPEDANMRRLQLQRWIQRIGGQPLIATSEAFQSFLLNAQKEVQKEAEEEVQLEVYFVNEKSVKVTILSTDQTGDVLEKVSPLELSMWAG